jgi:UDP-N-acetylglucosamine acyltransferase
LVGLNIEGLRRHGFDDDRLHSLKHAYTVLFCSGKLLEVALQEAEQNNPTDDVRCLIAFARSSPRGMARPRR